MFKLKKLFIIIFLFITTIIPQEKLSFSALSMQGKTINGQKVEIFKKNVQVTYKGMILYSDIATHYKEKQKVILDNGVKMIDGNDSLTCDQLIIFNDKNERYNAIGNVEFYQQDRQLSCNNFIYWTAAKKIKASGRLGQAILPYYFFGFN